LYSGTRAKTGISPPQALSSLAYQAPSVSGGNPSFKFTDFFLEQRAQITLKSCIAVAIQLLFENFFIQLDALHWAKTWFFCQKRNFILSFLHWLLLQAWPPLALHLRKQRSAVNWVLVGSKALW
jgi:hypothetical protein